MADVSSSSLISEILWQLTGGDNDAALDNSRPVVIEVLSEGSDGDDSKDSFWSSPVITPPRATGREGVGNMNGGNTERVSSPDSFFDDFSPDSGSNRAATGDEVELVRTVTRRPTAQRHDDDGEVVVVQEVRGQASGTRAPRQQGGSSHDPELEVLQVITRRPSAIPTPAAGAAEGSGRQTTKPAYVPPVVRDSRNRLKYLPTAEQRRWVAEWDSSVAAGTVRTNLVSAYEWSKPPRIMETIRIATVRDSGPRDYALNLRRPEIHYGICGTATQKMSDHKRMHIRLEDRWGSAIHISIFDPALIADYRDIVRLNMQHIVRFPHTAVSPVAPKYQALHPQPVQLILRGRGMVSCARASAYAAPSMLLLHPRIFL